MSMGALLPMRAYSEGTDEVIKEIIIINGDIGGHHYWQRKKVELLFSGGEIEALLLRRT